MAAGCTLLTFFSPADDLLHLLPLGHTIAWSRSVMVLPFALAVLGRLRSRGGRILDRTKTIFLWAAWALAAAAVLAAAVVAGVVLGLDPGGLASTRKPHRAGGRARRRRGRRGGAEVARRIDRHLSIGTERPRRYVVVALLGVNAGFLILSGVSFWSESSTYFSPTPAVSCPTPDGGNVSGRIRIVQAPVLPDEIDPGSGHTAGGQHRVRHP